VARMHHTGRALITWNRFRIVGRVRSVVSISCSLCGQHLIGVVDNLQSDGGQPNQN
jgi:hypothetical protein